LESDCSPPRRSLSAAWDPCITGERRAYDCATWFTKCSQFAILGLSGVRQF
jgi:hypothetical protein